MNVKVNYNQIIKPEKLDISRVILYDNYIEAHDPDFDAFEEPLYCEDYGEDYYLPRDNRYLDVFKKRFTKKNALKMTKRIWTFMAEAEFEEELHHMKDTCGGSIYANGCPLCEYHMHWWGFDYSACSERCPLIELWPNGCEESGPYKNVRQAFEMGHINMFKKYCRRIADAASKKLNYFDA